MDLKQFITTDPNLLLTITIPFLIFYWQTKIRLFINYIIYDSVRPGEINEKWYN